MHHDASILSEHGKIEKIITTAKTSQLGPKDRACDFERRIQGDYSLPVNLSITQSVAKVKGSVLKLARVSERGSVRRVGSKGLK
jgi:hypothetical protein